MNPTDVDPILWAFLGAMAALHRIRTLEEMVVTSLRRAPGPRPSKHSPPPGELCSAADVRRWRLDAHGETGAFLNTIRRRYGTHLGVLLEPEELTPEQIAERGGVEKVQPHIHVQLKVRLWFENPL